jgi:hypothetical protein
VAVGSPATSRVSCDEGPSLRLRLLYLEVRKRARVGRAPSGGNRWKGGSSTPALSCSSSSRAYWLRLRFHVWLEVWRRGGGGGGGATWY